MGRIIAVGDPHQCQPGSTIISMTGGTTKKLEEVKVGDEVVSYSRDSGCFVGRVNQGRKVLEVASRNYTGNMHLINAGGKGTYCTPNHKWVTRFVSRDKGLNVVYLMKKGDHYRLGWCQLFNEDGNNHLGVRTRIEKADAAWILSVHDNKTDASIEESFLATKYGLPLLPFKAVNGANHLTQEALDGFYSRLEIEEQHGRAIECLEFFSRDVRYPFYTVNDKERQGRSTIFVTQACNLLSGIMALPVYNGEREIDWQPLENDITYRVDLKVYSLKVETNETYVADGIGTHNSIYGFRGADITAFETFESMLNSRQNGCKTFRLTVCRRAPRSHIRLAQTLVPEIQWCTKENSGIEAPEGEIYQLDAYKAIDMMKEGDMCLSRVNKELIPVAYQLIRRRKKVVIRGRDFGEGLTGLIKKMKAISIKDLMEKLSEWYDKQAQKFCIKEGVSKPDELETNASRLQDMNDKVGCIVALCEGVETLDELMGVINDLFKSFEDDGKPKAAVVMGTVHRTKGLEAHNVFMLDPQNFPHKMAKKPWERVQERNLAYVGVTRSAYKLSKNGEIIEPGRLIFVGRCPTIFNATWLTGEQYPKKDNYEDIGGEILD